MEYQDISPEDFSRVDFSQATLLDLRDPNVRLVQGELPGSLNVPLAEIGTGLAAIPAGKPVYVYCDTGSFSREIAELLADRGLEAYSLVGGFRAYQAFAGQSASIVEGVPSAGSADPATSGSGAPRIDAPASAAPSDAEPAAGASCRIGARPVYLDAKGLKCPGPIVKVADTLKDLPAGSRLLVQATEDAFASDIRIWCERTGNTLESLEVKPDVIEATIAKAAPIPADAAPAGTPHGKTFVVFSGDLDKTIAAFIMANGGAAMGREVTMFFTFWGLNILRRPEPVKTSKGMVGRMFGAMMPRGTKKLGLSRMNMGGAGAKMIRGVMKANGIASLEELIDTARAHGVRLVACQMSMDIMGIAKEELIDGVELGGVSTFLGSGEQSDMSLFI